MDIEKRVLLLAILKKANSDSLNEVLLSLEEMFSLKQGKQYIKELKKDSFIINNELSFKGLSLAKQIEEEFKI